MSEKIPVTGSPNERRDLELEPSSLQLTGFNVQRIVLELIKKYMLANTPEDAGVQLAQRYDIDSAKSQIRLDIGFNWKTQDMDKVPAVYVQRGDIDLDSPTMGQNIGHNEQDSEDTKLAIYRMPVIVTCVAAAPLAVVENLAEYVRQPLHCFRQQVKLDFRLRGFQLKKISAPIISKENKNNFIINMEIDTAFDENWVIKREGLKLKTIGLEIFDGIVNEQCNCNR